MSETIPMYQALYKLQRSPFEITPDPSFLFPTKRHNDALAALYYGVRWRKGFVVLTGAVGTGKTLLLRCLLQLLEQSKDVKYAYLCNSRLSSLDFLQYVVRDFGLATSGKRKGELLFELCNYVVKRGLQNLTTVLIVDEAHNLSAEALEEVRLLTNLETAQHKLLQVVLVGQPELNDKLDSVNLTQLKQRITVRSHLEPLTLDETRGYIEKRMKLAGAGSAEAFFPPATVEAVHRHSGGIPRLINTLCENGLMSAYGKKIYSVSPKMIDDLAKEFRLDVVRPIQVQRTAAVEEMSFQSAARILLDLYASLHKTLPPNGDSSMSVAKPIPQI
jgi:general secretion pathway protein A